MKRQVLLFILFGWCFSFFYNSQLLAQSLIYDTVSLSKGDIILIQKKKYQIKKDTTFYIPTDVKYKVKKYNYGNADALIDTIRSNQKSDKFVYKALQLLLKNESTGTYGYYYQRGETPFIPYQQKVIKKIKYVRLEPFGPTIYDTTKTATSWLAKTGNNLQFKTNERVIRNNMLFDSGDKVDPELFSDNERILRTLPYIVDAKILVDKVSENSDSVVVTVITKDVWSEAFGLSTTDFTSGQLDIWNNNILGFGKEARHSIFWDDQEKQTLGYEGQFKVKNLYGSFTELHLDYLNRFGTKSYFGKAERKFFSSNIRTAGGLEIGKTKSHGDIRIGDTLLTNKFYDVNYFDFWLGRSFPIPTKNLLLKQKSNIVFSMRFINNDFKERPKETDDLFFHRFHKRTTYLGSIAFSKQSFRRSSLIYSYGRIEDVPYGALVNLTGGLEVNEFYTRPYLGLHASHSKSLPMGGYIYSGANFGGFLRNQKIEQGVLGINALYFSRLLNHGANKSRIFVKTSFSRGINRFDDELISINNKEGIVGLRSDHLYGNQKILLNLESVTFSPYYIYGFRVAFYLFSDLGWICSTSQRPAYEGKFYTGHGFGFRFRNERLAFNTIQLRLAWYPKVPMDSNPSYIQFSGENRLRIENFFAKAPEIIKFR